MGLPKGMTNNPNGRPKGAVDKVNRDLRAKVNQLIEVNFETIQTDIDNLEGKDRLMFIEKLLKYCLPTLQSVESKTDLSGLTDSQLDLIINAINLQDDGND